MNLWKDNRKRYTSYVEIFSKSIIIKEQILWQGSRELFCHILNKFQYFRHKFHYGYPNKLFLNLWEANKKGYTNKLFLNLWKDNRKRYTSYVETFSKSIIIKEQILWQGSRELSYHILNKFSILGINFVIDIQISCSWSYVKLTKRGYTLFVDNFP